MSARSQSGRLHAALFELMRGDKARAAPNAFELARLARDIDLPTVVARLACFSMAGRTLQSGVRRPRARGHASRRQLLRDQNVLCSTDSVRDCAR